MDFRGKLILAPLAGITDRTFRLLCRENGGDVTVTEMVSTRGWLAQPERTARYLEYGEGERPVGAQLFGAVPEEMAEAAAEIRRLRFDFVDINMGGPVRKVTAGGAGGGPVSPRTRGQMLSGTADWGQIARLKREFPDRVVIGNGDVRQPEDSRRMVSETGCDAVMIGRAALGNPWIFSAIRRGVAVAAGGGGPGGG